MRKTVRAMPVFLIAMALLLLLAALHAALPERRFSQMENRALQAAPSFSLRAVGTGEWMRAAETYLADQFPLRPQWLSLTALADAALLRRERNGILIGKEGWLFEASRDLPEKTALDNAAALQTLAESVDVPVTLMLVPLSSAVYGEALPEAYAPGDQDALLRKIAAAVPGAQTVDLTGALRAAKGGAPLFFRTDHHWTSVGAAIGYRALAKALGFSAPSEAEAAENLGDTYGSYYARAPSPLIAPDAFALAFPEDVALYVEGEAKQGLYDAEAMRAARDKYAALLYGNHGHITLTSGAAGGTLVVIKDSYANMLLPLLTRHFGRVEAIDPRYYQGDLRAYLAETEKEGVLCVYGLTIWLKDRNLIRHTALFEGASR